MLNLQGEIFMKTTWKEVPRDHVQSQWAAFYVTMNRKGEIVMSRVTHDRLGAPRAFQLYYDTVNNRIGLKPAALAARNAYPAGPSGNRGGRVVRAYRLMQEFGVIINETLQFNGVEIDYDGLLVLDVRTARISPRAVGNRYNRAKQRIPTPQPPPEL